MLVSICNLYLLLLLSTIGSLTVYYYEEQKISLWQCWKGLILLLNTIIPLSLYFCYHSASWILAKKLERQFNIKIQPHGTCSFQNQINSICTDKTGTLSLGNTLLYKVAFQFQESSCVQSSWSKPRQAFCLPDLGSKSFIGHRSRCSFGNSQDLVL